MSQQVSRVFLGSETATGRIAATMFHVFTSELMIHIVAPLSLLLIHTLAILSLATRLNRCNTNPPSVFLVASSISNAILRHNFPLCKAHLELVHRRRLGGKGLRRSDVL